eukprot:scaffold4335_cov148-Skeletonema_menzelii.AAC.11
MNAVVRVLSSVDSFLRAFFLRGEGEKHREIPENLAMAAKVWWLSCKRFSDICKATANEANNNPPGR